MNAKKDSQGDEVLPSFNEVSENALAVLMNMMDGEFKSIQTVQTVV